MQPIKYTVKLALMGDPRVGKSALRQRFLGLGFTETYIPTIGLDYSIKDTLIGGKQIRGVIMDLAGQKNFRVLREKYFVGVTGVLLVFDVTHPYDASKQILPWVKEVLEYTNEEGVPLAVVGNKIDLRYLREIQGYTGNNATADVNVSQKFPIEYFETSAKDGTGVINAFEWALEQALQIIEQP